MTRTLILQHPSPSIFYRFDISYSPLSFRDSHSQESNADIAIFHDEDFSNLSNHSPHLSGLNLEAFIQNAQPRIECQDGGKFLEFLLVVHIVYKSHLKLYHSRHASFPDYIDHGRSENATEWTSERGSPPVAPVSATSIRNPKTRASCSW